MKAMSDKDLDKLFQQRFDTFEAEPAADLWNSITAKLEDKKGKKKSYPVFWMAAASVVIVMSAGLWFYRPVEVIKLHAKSDDQVIADKPVERILNPADSVSPDISGHENIVSGKRKLAGIRSSKNKNNLIKSHQENEAIPDKKVSADHIPIKPVEQEINLLAQSKTVLNPGDKVQPILLVKADNESSGTEIKTEAPHKRIRSIGSLVNFVIAQVDKREDKIIEFRDDDEGSEVSGINLGVVKIKSRNK
jgi:hypothetical protein